MTSLRVSPLCSRPMTLSAAPMVLSYAALHSASTSKTVSLTAFRFNFYAHLLLGQACELVVDPRTSVMCLFLELLASSLVNKLEMPLDDCIGSPPSALSCPAPLRPRDKSVLGMMRRVTVIFTQPRLAFRPDLARALSCNSPDHFAITSAHPAYDAGARANWLGSRWWRPPPLEPTLSA